MRIKPIIILFVIFIVVFLIYKINKDEMVYYVNISDNKEESYSDNIENYLSSIKKLEKYINDFSNDDYRVTDLIRDINDNKVISNNQTIQNALIKADVLTLQMGNNELNYKASTQDISELFDYCDTLINDIDKLFALIRKYCKEDIYFLGFYNNNSDYYDEIYNYLNLKIADLSSNYDIKFIDIGNINEEEENIRISEIILDDYIIK